MNETTNPIWIGCSGWSYPDWEGPFYPEGMDSGEYLGWYADRFPIVEVNSTFYRVPSKGMIQGWRDRTPAGFRFVLKVPQVITHQKQLRDTKKEVDEFVEAILPLGDKLTGVLLQLGYFNRGAFASLDDFLDVLDPFLADWPGDKVPLAVEVRNPRWVGPKLVEVLRDHHAVLTLTDQTWMPKPAEVAGLVNPVTGPFGLVRLLGDRESIEKVTTTWGKIVVDRSANLAESGWRDPVDGRARPGRRLHQQSLRGEFSRNREGAAGPARTVRSRASSASEDNAVRLTREGRWTRPVRSTGPRSSGRFAWEPNRSRTNSPDDFTE